MKKSILFILCALTSIFITGCASTDNTSSKQKIKAPEWYINGGKRDSTGIYAIGTSTLSDKTMAEKAARVDGRAALAQVLEATISHVVDSVVVYDNDTKHYLKESTKIVSNQVLVGSIQVDKFEYNDEVAVLMFLPYKDMLTNLKSTAEQQEDEKLKSFLTELTIEQLEN